MAEFIEGKPQNEGISAATVSSTESFEDSAEKSVKIGGVMSVGLNSDKASGVDTENDPASEPQSASIQPESPAAGEIERFVEKNPKKPSAEKRVDTEKNTDDPSIEALSATKGNINKIASNEDSTGKKKSDKRSKKKTAAGAGYLRYIGFFVAVALIMAVFFSGNMISALKIKFIKEPTPAVEVSVVDPVIPETIQVTEEQAEPDREFAAIKAEQDFEILSYQEADAIREELLLKADEIIQLRQYYTDKISEIEQAVKAELQKAGISDYAHGIKVKRVELNLKSIQRRQMYIDKLAQPFNWVESGSEEILYLKRKALLDEQVAEIAAGVDMKKHLRHLNSAIQKYRPTAEKLMIDTHSAETEPLETIWNRITARNDNAATIFENGNDQVITAEICSGNLARMAEISTLTTKGAKCISEIPGTELFLNRISQITPSAAAHLFRWNGNWICLNGVRKISPAVARSLFQWQGEWISLNGLEELPPGLAKYLPNWGGRQLELMGLKLKNRKSAKDRIGFKYLARWEEAGGKLYVSDEIREEMKY